MPFCHNCRSSTFPLIHLRITCTDVLDVNAEFLEVLRPSQTLAQEAPGHVAFVPRCYGDIHDDVGEFMRGWNGYIESHSRLEGSKKAAKVDTVMDRVRERYFFYEEYTDGL